MIAALYIDPRGPYARMEGVDPWDDQRDARRYEGPWPVVAHPPCGPWGDLRHLYRGNEQDCGPCAVDAVRRFGGVLEHPAGSQLWRACRLPFPGELPDAFGGYTAAVTQVSWGHVARKPTWLYFVGIHPELVQATLRKGGTPTHWVSGRRGCRDASSNVPRGIKVCSAQQRRRTPTAFADWLVMLARSVTTEQQQHKEKRKP